MTKQCKIVAGNVETTFAPSGNPWGQLMKHESKTMKPTPATAPAKKQIKPKMSAAQASARIDVDALKVMDVPFPGRTVSLVSKYAAKFATLPVNQRLVCETKDAPAIAGSLKQWIEKHKPGHVARHIKDCGDGKGGVWLLKDEK